MRIILLSCCAGFSIFLPFAWPSEVLVDPDYEVFDQTPGKGWRAVAEAGDYLVAARMIEDYLRDNDLHLDEFQTRNLHFHAGQLYAIDDRYPQAADHFRLARWPGEPADSFIKWDAYVRANLAFVTGDRALLADAQAEMSAWQEQHRGAPNNLVIVRRFLASPSTAYRCIVFSADGCERNAE